MLENQEQDEVVHGMEDFNEDEMWGPDIKLDNEISRINARIFKAIYNQIGAGYLKDLKELIKEGGIHGALRFTQDEPPHRYFQKEHEGGCISASWVNGWSAGDSFTGVMWVKLKNGLYLEMDFSC